MYSKIRQHVTVYYVFILFQVGLFCRDLADRFCMSATVLSHMSFLNTCNMLDVCTVPAVLPIQNSLHQCKTKHVLGKMFIVKLLVFICHCNILYSVAIVA
jgi:hypothetical protein